MRALSHPKPLDRPRHARMLRAAAAITIAGFVLAGCGTTSTGAGARAPVPVRDAANAGPDERIARGMREQQRYFEAAAEFEALVARAPARAQPRLRLLAAEAYGAGGDFARADALLRSADPADPLARTVAARLSLAEGGNAAALLPTLPERLPDSRDALLLDDVRATALARSGQPLESVRLRTAMDLGIDVAAVAARNRQALWRTASELPSGSIESARAGASGAIAGWLDLALIARRSADPEAFTRAITEWRSAYPGHRANLEVVPELALAIEGGGTLPRTVALLLPLSGRFAEAAGAIRDGFLAAANVDYGGADARRVIVKDTTGGAGVAAQYRAAIAEGAQLVVGPLRRGQVAEVLRSGAVTVPTLLLNYSPLDEGAVLAGEAGSYVQFSLAPQDEAARVAERAYADGHRRAAVLVPEGAWGERVALGFGDAWREAGGAVTVSEPYPVNPAELSLMVAELLGTERVERRARNVGRAAGRRLDFEPQPRSDIDAVLLAAFPVEARQIMPLLAFHRADALAVYATSHVNADLNAQERRDLDGLRFGDMPWLVADGSTDPLLRQRERQALSNASPAMRRFFAFGADALRIAARMGYLAAQPAARFDGQTGTLSITPDGRVRRELRFARYDAGEMQLDDAGN